MDASTSQMTPSRVLGGRGKNVNVLTGSPQIDVASRAQPSRYRFGIDSNNIFPGGMRASTTCPTAMGASSSDKTCLFILRILLPGVVGVNSTVRYAGTITLMPGRMDASRLDLFYRLDTTFSNEPPSPTSDKALLSIVLELLPLSSRSRLENVTQRQSSGIWSVCVVK